MQRIHAISVLTFTWMGVGCFGVYAGVRCARAQIYNSVQCFWPDHSVLGCGLAVYISQSVYMRMPEGFAQKNDNRVCRLRNRYELKQASKNWYEKFTIALKNIGFIQSRADYTLFIFKRGSMFITALIYMDDIILASTNIDKINEVKRYLDYKFTIKNLKPLLEES